MINSNPFITGTRHSTKRFYPKYKPLGRYTAVEGFLVFFLVVSDMISAVFMLVTQLAVIRFSSVVN